MDECSTMMKHMSSALRVFSPSFDAGLESRLADLPSVILEPMCRDVDCAQVIVDDIQCSVDTLRAELNKRRQDPLAAQQQLGGAKWRGVPWRGIECYEVTRALGGRFVALAEHTRRLELSIAATLLSDVRPDEAGASLLQDCMRRIAESHWLVLRANGGLLDRNVKTLVWRRGDELGALNDASEIVAAGSASAQRDLSSAPLIGFCTYFVKSFYPPKEAYDSGVVLGLLHAAARERESRNAKTIQQTLRDRAAALQKSSGCFEVLLVDDAAHDFLVPEGSRSNYVCLAPDGSIVSSPDDDILCGVTRTMVKQCCAEHGIPFVARRLRLQDLFDPTQVVAMAMLGTSVGVLPIKGLYANLKEVRDERELALLTEALARGAAGKATGGGGALPDGGSDTATSPEEEVYAFASASHAVIHQLHRWYLDTAASKS